MDAIGSGERFSCFDLEKLSELSELRDFKEADLAFRPFSLAVIITQTADA